VKGEEQAMAQALIDMTSAGIVPLAWDTAHFGIPVGRIETPETADEGLAALLGEARRAGYQLVYWATEPSHPVSPTLLDQFCGSLVDRKVAYHRELVPTTSAELPDAVGMEEYPATEPTPRLIELAVAAGRYSRFAADPHLRPGLFESLYEKWIRRSTRREIADTVLVTYELDRPDEVLGMITVAQSGASARIGLVAVHESGRGRGLGLALLQAAQCWMLKHGVSQATVVTQAANVPACRCYEKAGYRLGHTRHHYHFWPQLGLSA
jgi:dTDP-4-amino-4,6-dideoxy-D-galactose acyltransferase